MEAGENIKAGQTIEAGQSIEEGETIEAGQSIEAGKTIEVRRTIESVQNMESGGQEKNRSRKRTWKYGRRTGPLLLVLAGIMVLAGTALVCYFRSGGLPAAIQAEIDIRPDGRAVDGSLRGSGGEPVPEGEYLVMVNQLPTIKEGSRDCNIEFENPAENHYSARINLYQNSDGKLLGGTRRVDPGQYVETIELNQELKSGEYPVLARIELFTGTTPAGSLSLEITLRVIK